jgi:indole-3-glycerol phosphate synthase
MNNGHAPLRSGCPYTANIKLLGTTMTTQAFVKTDTILDQILARTVQTIAEDKTRITEADMRQRAEHANQDAAFKPRDFAGTLRRATVTLIAEVKKASPSKGVLIHDFDPVAIGTTYAANGAAAISVLTDEPFFQGHLDYMRAVRQAVHVPVLRKDFIVDPYQVYQARANGADATLLIVAALDDAQLRDLRTLITELGMAALVEVHTESEVERALACGATLIGINNRDLKTFHVDLNVTARVAQVVPPEITLVAESGIGSAEDVRRMGELGAHAVLVGELLMKAGESLAERVQAFSQQKRPD